MVVSNRFKKTLSFKTLTGFLLLWLVLAGIVEFGLWSYEDRAWVVIIIDYILPGILNLILYYLNFLFFSIPNFND